MDKFKISQLMDYFLKTNSVGTSYKDLSQEDLASLAILSVFDKKGQTIKTSNYRYERPDGVIDEAELNISKQEYEKAVKHIYKEIKKEVGKEFTGVNIPSYEDLQAMLKGDNKIDFEELHLFAREGIIKKPDTKAPKPVLIPEKTGNNTKTPEQMQKFLDSVETDPTKIAAIERIDAKLSEATKNGTTAFDFSGLTDKAQAEIDAFVPDNDAAYNKQEGLDGKQYNANGQVVTRINNLAGAYEKYKYTTDSSDAKYSEMMRYNGNGYKTDYFRRETLTDKDGKTFTGVVIYHLNEEEKIVRITYPEDAVHDERVDDFNDYNMLMQWLQYDEAINGAE